MNFMLREIIPRRLSKRRSSKPWLRRDLASIIPIMAVRSITWLSYTKPRATTPTPKHFIGARWRSKNTPWARGHPDVAMSLYNLANVYRLQGKYDEAGKFYKRALAIEEKALGTSHPQVANTLNGLALVHHLQGDYTNAEELYKRAIVILQKALGANHLNVTLPVSNLANVYQEQGKYREAEALHKRVLAIREHALGTNHPDVAQILNNLANDYQAEGNYDEAEVLHKRALAIRERALGMNHPDVAESLYNLAFVERWQGKYDQAEGLFKRALTIEEVTLGTSHPEIARTFQGLANVYYVENKYAAAEELYKRALAISEQTLGMSHLDVAFTLNNLGNVYTAQDKYREAEEFFKRALAIRELALGTNHPDAAWTRNDLALSFAKAGNIKSALEYARKSTATLIAHAATETPISQQKFDAVGIRGERNGYFLNHIAFLHAAVQQRGEPLAAAAREAFDIAQWANQSSAATAIQQLGLRFATGDGALAALARESQDLSATWRERDKALVTALSEPDVRQNRGGVDALRNQIAEIEAKIAANALRLEKQFPDYAALANPKPLKTDEVQQLLGNDEALVFLVSAQQHWETYIFALTRDGFEWKTIPLGTKILAQKVAMFRRGLDEDALHRGLERLECTQAEADKRGLSRIECARVVVQECTQASTEDRGLWRAKCGQAELFDLGLAHELYETLLGLVEPLIKGKRHLIVVPSGPLTALPFHLLVTNKPTTATPGDLTAYRNTQWLLKRHAVSVLPSVGSLKALRVFARKDEAKQPMIGFGDPVFNAEEESKPSAEQRKVAATRSYTEFWKGVDIDRSLLSKALPRLPETSAELQAVAQNLGAPPSSIHLRQDASESTVKRAALADYRVVYFATHGLVAGEIKGLAEPSLALTLPKQPSDTDDGLLTASEVAQLKLNAEWVVLSACNTIAGDKPGAEALSGLARAFFYAGARALLVSHWAVDSNAAMRLTTSTFDIMKKDPTLGRAEALRRSMLAYMNDATNPLNAYRALWAPFVVVGEGAGQPVAAMR
jgi:CHAT domain-containing protein/Tfp pilus assembly protein PilF